MNDWQQQPQKFTNIADRLSKIKQIRIKKKNIWNFHFWILTLTKYVSDRKISILIKLQLLLVWLYVTGDDWDCFQIIEICSKIVLVYGRI